MNKPEKSSGQEKFDLFRAEYRYMEYSGYEARVDEDGLYVRYSFDLAGKHVFHPEFRVPRKSFYKDFPTNESLQSPLYKNLLFHIGMIELISYWKTACPKEVVIKNIKLTPEQVSWWKTVFYYGLGEFFYTNEIQIAQEDFMNISSEGETIPSLPMNADDAVIVPIGGGKDSVVTLELLNKTLDIRPFIMNPREATLECAYVAGFGNDGFIEVNRRLDPLLLKLNAEGFLNGHTPFSALLAFYSLLVANMSGHRHIALSNESSANEPTVIGTEVNHQYSKSFVFESFFRDYVHEYITPDANYFSFLRPLNELQIAKLFARYVKYYSVFKSCNVGSKTDIWCCNCPKCLFAFIILSPFIPMIELVHIFQKNLFELPSMIPYLKELTGVADEKPFECVGTINEVNAALHLFIANHKLGRQYLLIDYYTNTSAYVSGDTLLTSNTLNEFNDAHFLEPAFLEILKKELHD